MLAFASLPSCLSPIHAKVRIYKDLRPDDVASFTRHTLIKQRTNPKVAYSCTQ
jgi:hypothetical protein